MPFVNLLFFSESFRGSFFSSHYKGAKDALLTFSIDLKTRFVSLILAEIDIALNMQKLL